jgi:Tol biopolymer transport system component
MTMTRLTQLGNVTGCTNISPDGKYVTYCTSEGPRGTLYLRQVAAAAAVKVSELTSASVTTTFSPDGNFVYLSEPRGLFEVPVLGGEPRRILSDLLGPVSISPDGKQMAFLRMYAETREVAVLVTNLDGGGERRVWTGKWGVDSPNFGVSWSPDAEQLAFGLVRRDKSGLHATLGKVDIATGQTSLLTDERWDVIHRLVWLPDGSGLVFAAASSGSRNTQLWFLSLPDGKARRITNDLNEYQSFSIGVTGDSQTIAAARIEQQSTVHTSTMTGDEVEPFSVGAGPDGASGVEWLPDGRLVYSSTAAGGPAVMVAERGKPPRTLTAKDDSPSLIEVSPDGRHIVFSIPIGEAQNIFRLDVESGERIQLTRGANQDWYPMYTPDGAWVVFTRLEEGRFVLWKVPAAGGEATRLTGEGSYLGMDVAQDGKTVLAGSGDRPQVVLVRVADGGVEKVLDKPRSLEWWRLRFSPDSRSLVYARTEAGVSNLWTLPLNGGPPQQLTQFSVGRIFSFDFSPDGKRIAMGRGALSGDVVLIKNFK